MVLIYLKAFLVGGLICLVGELLLLYTRMTSARILVSFVVLGIALSALGLYGPLTGFAGAGATVPLTGFGHLLAQGAIKGAKTAGLFGALTGGVKAAAGGITAAIVLGFLASLVFSPKTKD